MANAFGQYLLILTIDLNTVWLLLAMCDLYISSWPASITRQKKTNYQHKTITNNAMGSISFP